MNELQLKSDLHRLIDNASNLNILNAIKTILARESERKYDWADNIDNILLNELEESIKEVDKGETMTHEEAMTEIRKRYKL